MKRNAKLLGGALIVAVILIGFFALRGNTNPTHDSTSDEEMMMGDMDMNAMMGEDSKKREVFSESTEGLPDVQPTKLVQLKDGDRFEMTAEMVKQTVGNREIKRLAYNRQIPGPIIQVEKDATITLKLTNKLDVPTTLHSHGIRLDDTFDGVPFDMGGTQEPMQPGESFEYTLTFPDTGVFWYHPHVREDYTQELGLYGNFSVVEDGYWNDVDGEEFLVLDDFSEDDPFYKDLTNKTLMGRFGNIMLINNQENFSLNVKQYETKRFYITNTANTRTFDFAIAGQQLKMVGGDIGRVEKEYMVDNVIIAPAERYIVEVRFDTPGTYPITSRDRTLGTIVVEKSDLKAPAAAFDDTLRENLNDYTLVRDNFQEFLDRPNDKSLRLTIQMKGDMAMDMNMDDMNMDDTMMADDDHGNDDGIEWEDGMATMNDMSTDKTIEWAIIDETDPDNPKKNVDMNDDWKFQLGDMVKIKIFNDPESMHPMQHPIHFHGQRFVVLTRDGVENSNLQWKDTTLVTTGETIEILVEMSNPGKWITHCHIAEHMHAGMMFNFEVS